MKKATEKQIKFINALFGEVFLNPEKFVNFESLTMEQASSLIDKLQLLKKKIREKVGRYDISRDYAKKRIEDSISKLSLSEEVKRKISALEYDAIFDIDTLSRKEYFEELRTLLPASLPNPDENEKAIYLFGVENGEIVLLGIIFPKDIEILDAEDTLTHYYNRLKEYIRMYG